MEFAASSSFFVLLLLSNFILWLFREFFSFLNFLFSFYLMYSHENHDRMPIEFICNRKCAVAVHFTALTTVTPYFILCFCFLFSSLFFVCKSNYNNRMHQHDSTTFNWVSFLRTLKLVAKSIFMLHAYPRMCIILKMPLDSLPIGSGCSFCQ